jgi:hypothetical protein
LRGECILHAETIEAYGGARAGVKESQWTSRANASKPDTIREEKNTV